MPMTHLGMGPTLARGPILSDRSAIWFDGISRLRRQPPPRDRPLNPANASVGLIDSQITVRESDAKIRRLQKQVQARSDGAARRYPASHLSYRRWSPQVGHVRT